MSGQIDNIVVPVYKREQWTRWQELFKNTKAAMLWSYDKWLKNHNQTVDKFKAVGNSVARVEVDIDDYLAWADDNGLRIDGETRGKFALEVFGGRAKSRKNMRN